MHKEKYYPVSTQKRDNYNSSCLAECIEGLRAREKWRSAGGRALLVASLSVTHYAANAAELAALFDSDVEIRSRLRDVSSIGSKTLHSRILSGRPIALALRCPCHIVSFRSGYIAILRISSRLKRIFGLKFDNSRRSAHLLLCL